MNRFQIKLFIIFFLIPQVVLSQELLKLDPDFVGEEKINKTTYLSEEERKQFLLQIKNGKVMEQNGTEMDTRLLPSGLAIYVYAQDGNIYISKRKEALKFHHSSIVAGEDVICAGTIKVERGTVKLLTDLSPMYIPKDEKPLRKAIKKLKALGVDMGQAKVFFKKNL